MSLYEEAIEAFRAADSQRARELAERLLEESRVDGLCMLARIPAREGDAATAKRLALESRESAADEEGGRRLSVEEALS